MEALMIKKMEALMIGTCKDKSDREVLREFLRKTLEKNGPLDWSEFQRLASKAYGTGEVGRIRAKGK